MSTALAKVGGGFTLAPTSWKELLEFAELAAKSDLVPKDYRGKPANIVLAVQWGGELGVAPLQALQGIAVINGRAAVWGDLMLALCMQHPDYVDTVETYDEKTMTATCVAKRKGRSDKIHTFSQEDVKRAGLGSTHNTYPKRMKQNRARGFALRDQWTDVLKGMVSVEEAKDYKREVRADVVDEAPPAEEPKQLSEPKREERKSAPPPAAEGPAAIAASFPNKEWASKLLTEAPFEILEDYRVWLEAVLQDGRRSKLHNPARRALEHVSAEVDRRIETAPVPAADPIIQGLEREVYKQRELTGDAEPSYLEGDQ